MLQDTGDRRKVEKLAANTVIRYGEPKSLDLGDKKTLDFAMVCVACPSAAPIIDGLRTRMLLALRS